ncbi:MAG: copper resistance protein CopC [Alphaproteobacteria bacterium]
MIKQVLASLAASALCALATPAFAHALLQHANPAAGAVVHASPNALRLTYNDAVYPDMSDLTIEDAAHHRVSLGALTTADHGVTLVAPLSTPLAPGLYHVRWHAVSQDLHDTHGEYIFRVAP